ncbi:RHS repeat-associated core domain-containing protein [Pseudomonas sp. NPDC089392]|uniref:RHS repeat-associated core domain-containing protein n=1 Tax=Pseudomonas sp. NPDC089392 TaxID=3364459 RepID=UPI003809F675
MHKNIYFYKNSMLCTEIGTISKHYLRADGIIVGQRDSRSAACQLLQCDLATTVLGLSTTPAKCRYSPYGFRETNDHVSEFGFAGKRLDKVSGCYPLGNGHRFYSPMLTRFIQADALSPFSAGGINAYAYCQDDPINRHDPSGRFFEWLRRSVSRLNLWLSPETPSPSRRSSLTTQDTTIEIEPLIPQIIDELTEVTIGAANHVLSATVNDLTRPFTEGRRAITHQWNRLPDPVQQALVVGATFTIVPAALTTALAAARTGSFLPVTPTDFYSILFYGPTDAQRIALDLRRNSF